jgi:hypothetical protein
MGVSIKFLVLFMLMHMSFETNDVKIKIYVKNPSDSAEHKTTPSLIHAGGVYTICDVFISKLPLFTTCGHLQHS